MEIRLPKERIIKTYQRYSLPVQEQEPAEVKKLQFFYIGRNARHVDKLKEFFEFGYTTASVDHAMLTLKRLLKRTEDMTIPDVIIVEAGVGMDKLTEFHHLLSGYKLLADMPLIIEATGANITGLKHCAFADEVLFLTEFTGAQLQQKVNFLKKVKQKYVHEPATCKVENSFPLYSDVPSFFKRVLDIAISASLLLLLTPVMLLIALAIRLESHGPILTGSKRVGRGYAIFELLKFRVVIEGGAGTRTGLVLRKTGLDDLPQLLNVLMGDLSLVGNRPLLLHEAALLTTDEAAKRFLHPAGITGLWQFRKVEHVQYEIWANTVMQETNV